MTEQLNLHTNDTEQKKTATIKRPIPKQRSIFIQPDVIQTMPVNITDDRHTRKIENT